MKYPNGSYGYYIHAKNLSDLIERLGIIAIMHSTDITEQSSNIGELDHNVLLIVFTL